MMRSLYSGVSGLQNHQTKLDVIGNNVANVNTIGFKKNRVNFQDMLYQSSQGATRPSDDLGGVNPKEVGLGMTVATIDTIHTQGSMQTTGNKSDLAVQGDGFFILKQGDSSFYTRAGAFNIDANGVLVNPASGMRVQGWAATTVDGENVVNASGDVGDLTIPMYGKEPARATSQVEMMCNLNKNTEIIPEDAAQSVINANTWVVDKNIYDSFGNIHQLRIEYTREPDTVNTWRGRVFINPTEENENPTELTVGLNGAEGAGTEFLINFDNLGALASVTDTEGNTLDTGELNITIGFNVPESNDDPEGGATRQDFNVTVGTVGSFEHSTTQSAQSSTNKSFKQDGYTMGYLTSFNIDNNGFINGVYTNGTAKVLGQIAMATFTNPGGLEKSGETNFVESINSGDALIDPASLAGKGKIASGMLEMSNVDLSAEFVDMIIAQRGFQANSKGIQTSDTMLQEILQLKR